MKSLVWSLTVSLILCGFFFNPQKSHARESCFGRGAHGEELFSVSYATRDQVIRQMGFEALQAMTGFDDDRRNNLRFVWLSNNKETHLAINCHLFPEEYENPFLVDIVNTPTIVGSNLSGDAKILANYAGTPLVAFGPKVILAFDQRMQETENYELSTCIRRAAKGALSHYQEARLIMGYWDSPTSPRPGEIRRDRLEDIKKGCARRGLRHLVRQLAFSIFDVYGFKIKGLLIEYESGPNPAAQISQVDLLDGEFEDQSSLSLIFSALSLTLKNIKSQSRMRHSLFSGTERVDIVTAPYIGGVKVEADFEAFDFSESSLEVGLLSEAFDRRGKRLMRIRVGIEPKMNADFDLRAKIERSCLFDKDFWCSLQVGFAEDDDESEDKGFYVLFQGGVAFSSGDWVNR